MKLSEVKNILATVEAVNFKLPDDKFVPNEPSSTSTLYNERNRIENIPKYPETLKNRFQNDENLTKLILTSKKLEKISDDSEPSISTFYNTKPKYSESLKNKFLNDQNLSKLILSSKKLEKFPVSSNPSTNAFYNGRIENIPKYSETLKNKFLSDESISKLISNLGPNSKHEYQNGKHIITGK